MLPVCCSERAALRLHVVVCAWYEVSSLASCSRQQERKGGKLQQAHNWALPPFKAAPSTACTPTATGPHPACLHHHPPCRRRNWLCRLYIEDSGVGFAGFVWSTSPTPPPAQAGAQPYYRFLPPSSEDSFLHIKLEGMGPKLLVSDVSTADQPLLRWRLAVRGNTAVEFGVVPLCLEVSPSSWVERTVCLVLR